MSKIVIALAVLTLFSCSKKDGEGTELPATIQQQIDESTDCTCDPYIKLYSWRGQPVYLRGYTGPVCNWTPAYYNENGKPIFMAAGYMLDQFLAEAQFIKTIWQCSEGD